MQILNLNNIKLQSTASKLMNRFFYERVLSDNAKNVVYKEALSAFLNPRDDETAVGIWQGEFWGKYMISACRVYKYTGDEELKEFIKQAAKEIISCQRNDGYIGSYKNSSNFFSPDPIEAQKVIGWPSDWNWNIWCRKYTLWGLLECYEVLGDEHILKSADNFALQLISEIQDNNADICDTGTFCGMPSCSILKPMLILYEYTNNEKYFDFCMDIADKWQISEKRPALLYNSLKGDDIKNWYPTSEKWAKAYEMMSCFDGIVKLYKITKNELYLNAAECFYDIIIKSELNPVMSVGYNDVFVGSAYEVNAVSEPCDAIHFIRLCHELYTVTANPRYIDSLELCYYNALLAGVFFDGKWAARGVRGAGRHMYNYEQAGFYHNHCCVNNMPRGLLNVVQSLVAHDEKGIYINIYEDAKINADFDNVSFNIDISGSYPLNLMTNIKLEFTKGRCPVFLRIPSWCDGAAITVNGKAYKADCGYFMIDSLAEKTDILIEFPDEIRVKVIKANTKAYTDNDMQLYRWKSPKFEGDTKDEIFLTQNRLILMRGPVILSKSKIEGLSESEIFNDSMYGKNPVYTFESAESERECLVSGILTCRTKDGSYDVKVCDYAYSANFISEDDKYFSIYF